MLTLVIAYRDRPLKTLENSLSSLARQTFKNFSVIIVDYGSRSELSSELNQLVSKFSFCRVVFSDTRGQLWNRSKALNIGIRLVDTPFVITTDADIFFPPHHLEIVARHLTPTTMVYCLPTRLPQNHPQTDPFTVPTTGDIDHHALGAFHGVSTQKLLELGGFDEFYRIWGREDVDLRIRLESVGIKAVILNSETAIYHFWHPPSIESSAGMLDPSFFIRATSYLERNRHRSQRNSDGWGHPRATSERTALKFMTPNGTVTNLLPDVVLKAIPTKMLWSYAPIQKFHSLHSGEAIALQYSETGFRTMATRFAKKFNSVLKFLRCSVVPDRDLFRRQIVQILEANEEFIQDYYLGSNENTETLVLVRV